MVNEVRDVVTYEHGLTGHRLSASGVEKKMQSKGRTREGLAAHSTTQKATTTFTQRLSPSKLAM